MSIDLMRTRFGSHLYGTDTPSSDIDTKAVVIPGARDILRQTVPCVLRTGPDKEAGVRNTQGDVDVEVFALHRYLDLLAEGQAVALDMLFAPAAMMEMPPHPVWREVFENRHRLVSRRSASFVSYCQQQAAKYGIKGSRVHAARAMVGWFDAAIAEHGAHARLSEAAASLEALLAGGGLAHTAIVPVVQASRPQPVLHLECCNRKVPYTGSLCDGRAIFARVFELYGARARAAESNQGVDWKALSHAVRVGHEALEFLATGFVTFPLPDAGRILRIKLGLVPYAAVATEIEGLLDRVVVAQSSSILPEEPDRAYIDDIVCRAYSGAVLDWVSAGMPA